MIITLLVHLVAPSISPEVMNETVNEGSNAFFSCQADGEPIPTISWYFNGTDTTKFIITNKTLDIVNVESSDAGIYTCIATNVVSNDTSSGVLTVNGEFDICSVLLKVLLNQACATHRPAHAWFLEIAFVPHCYTYVCVFPPR